MYICDIYIYIYIYIRIYVYIPICTYVVPAYPAYQVRSRCIRYPCGTCFVRGSHVRQGLGFRVPVTL